MVEICKKIVQNQIFQNTIIVIILINTVTMGLATVKTIREKTGDFFAVLDWIFLGIYILEIVLKFLAYYLRFFLDVWNVFDVFIVIFSAIPSTVGIQSLRNLRSFKALKGIKVVGRVEPLRVVVETTTASVVDILWILFLLVICFYIFGVIGCSLFSRILPEYFGNLWKTLFTLVQVMTFEGFHHDIARPLTKIRWWYSLYFVFFEMFAGFLLTNVIIGMICNTQDNLSKKAHAEKEEKQKLETLREELKDISLLTNVQHFDKTYSDMAKIVNRIEKYLTRTYHLSTANSDKCIPVVKIEDPV